MKNRNKLTEKEKEKILINYIVDNTDHTRSDIIDMITDTIDHSGDMINYLGAIYIVANNIGVLVEPDELFAEPMSLHDELNKVEPLSYYADTNQQQVEILEQQIRILANRIIELEEKLEELL